MNLTPLLIILLISSATIAADKNTYYFPEKGAEWATQSPTHYQIDPKALDKAVNFAQANEYSGSRDLRLALLKAFSREPYHELLGPTKSRGGPAGLILKNGYAIAKWGDTQRVDMTFSVTKSFLSTTFGLALDQNLIRSSDDKLKDYLWDRSFESKHNSQITWTHLLTQSSDWSGELWGGQDWADRPPLEGTIDDWKFRQLLTPGSHFEYNDVRVNLLAYSLLNVWRQPLPQVLKKHIMDPIGASTTWRWYGYSNSWINIDGVKMQSISGGGHSGGGLFIDTEDLARFGLLHLNQGKWKNQQLLSRQWIAQASHASPANENYGYMWWLNPNGSNPRMKAISKNAFYAAGFGGNYIIIEPDHDLVIVVRWLEPSQSNQFVSLLMDAIHDNTTPKG